MIYLKYIFHVNENDTIFVRSIQVSLHVIKFTIDNYEFLFSGISRCAVYPWILHSFFTAIWRQTEFISRMKRRRKVRTRKLLLSLYGKAAVIRITPRGKRQFNAGFVTVATVVLLASVLLTRRKIKFLPVTRLGAACFIAIRFKEIPRVEGNFIRQSSLDLSHLSFRVVSRKIPEVWHHPLGLHAIVKVKKCLLLHKNSFIFFFRMWCFAYSSWYIL